MEESGARGWRLTGRGGWVCGAWSLRRWGAGAVDWEREEICEADVKCVVGERERWMRTHEVFLLSLFLRYHLAVFRYVEVLLGIRAGI